MNDLQKRLEFSKKLAYKAGEIMLKYFQIGLATEIKADGTPVTVADNAVNDMVIDAIKKAYPNDAVYGEEGSLLKDKYEYLWVCDPIDGTIPYSCGIPTNDFTLALLLDGEPLISVVYDPYMKRLFTAVKGDKAFCNDKQIQVSKLSDLKDCIIGVSGNSKSNKSFDIFAFRAELQHHSSRQPQLLSFSYEGMMVATGQFGAAIFPGTPLQDVAPLKLIIEGAGGKVTSLTGEDQRYDKPINGAILSNNLIHDELIELIKPFLST